MKRQYRRVSPEQAIKYQRFIKERQESQKQVYAASGGMMGFVTVLCVLF